MHPEVDILFNSVIEAVRFPIVCKENQRHRLSKVVKLQSTGTNCIHNGSIVNDSCGDFEGSGT